MTRPMNLLPCVNASLDCSISLSNQALSLRSQWSIVDYTYIKAFYQLKAYPFELGAIVGL